MVCRRILLLLSSYCSWISSCDSIEVEENCIENKYWLNFRNIENKEKNLLYKSHLNTDKQHITVNEKTVF